jgi:Flp pilus assembly protein TadB
MHAAPANGRGGQQVCIDAAAAGAGRCRDAAAVDQNQRPEASETAQVDGAGTDLALGRGRELVGVTQNRTADRQALDEVKGAGRAATLQLVLADHLDRERGVFGTALAIAGGVVLLAGAVVFSVVLLAVAAVAGVLVGGYLWWKTRSLRRQLREQAETHPGAGSQPGGSPRDGTVIEGDFVRERDTGPPPS